MELKYFLEAYCNPLKNYKLGAYRMKHIYESATNIYLTEDQFIELMVSNGYRCNKRNEFMFSEKKSRS
jgi:hypothetical protein